MDNYDLVAGAPGGVVLISCDYPSQGHALESRHGGCFFCSVLLRLRQLFQVSIGVLKASCRKAGEPRPGYTTAVVAQRRSNPGNKIEAHKLSSMYGW